MKRLPAAKKPKKDMNACTDALFAVLKGYWLAYACQELGIDNVDSNFEHPILAPSVSVQEKQRFLVGLSMKIVENCTIIGGALLGMEVTESMDQKYNYTRSLCHYASLALEFYDAWHEGDGNRIIRCWKFFLLHFFESGRTKYSLDALRLQIQLSCLPSQLVKQITWDRFINTHGGIGHNIPCDLHNEHVNRQLKAAIRHMGANFSQRALSSVARSTTYISTISQNFDKQCQVISSMAHTTHDDTIDIKRIVSVVKNGQLWDIRRGRSHRKYKTLSTNPLKKLDRLKMEDWMKRKILDYHKYNQMEEGNLSEAEIASLSDSD